PAWREATSCGLFLGNQFEHRLEALEFRMPEGEGEGACARRAGRPLSAAADGASARLTRRDCTRLRHPAPGLLPLRAPFEEGDKAVLGHRRREQEPLAKIAAHLQEGFEFGRFLDSFRHRLAAKAAREI